jgi:hypothetical protein
MQQAKNICFCKAILVGVSKKTEKPIKPRKPKNNNWKNWTVKKNRLNWLEYLKKLTGSIQFWFHKLETEKSNRTEINNRAKQKKTKPNRNQTHYKKPPKTT